MSKQSTGSFVVIEGTDGSGKGTQFKLLENRLKREGYEVETFDFPQYDKSSSHFVREYLNGNYGTTNEVGPFTASLFYALDRYEAAPKIKQAIAQGKVVLANRFTGSNMAHQGTKFASAEQRRGYFLWLDQMEFELFKIPRPNMSFVLRVPAEIAQQLVDMKDKRTYTDKKRDIHEADINHLRRSVEVYDNMCQLFPRDFKQIDCVRDGSIMQVDTIHEVLWQEVKNLLPEMRDETEQAQSRTKVPDEPFIDNVGDALKITDAGKEYLKDKVTSVEGDVYGFYEEGLSPITVAAAMARLSRRGDDMRITILDEFTQKRGKDSDLLKRVITAFGDDSVQQLVGQYIVVENASNLLTKKLEWGRLGAYLEQSTRYIYFDKKNEHGKYRYHTPANLDAGTAQKYDKVMDEIFDKYSAMVYKLTDYVRERSKVPESERDVAWKGATRAQACDAIRSVLPVATKSTVGIFVSGQALENLIMHLLADELDEARVTGESILREARKTVDTFLERADKPDRGGASIAYRAEVNERLQKVSSSYLADKHSSDFEAVKLVDVSPRNELDIVADILYEHSHYSLEELRKQVAEWSYERKLNVMETAIGERLNRRHKPGRAFEKIHYSWDILCDYGIFRDLQRHRMVDDMNWQQLTPRYGYEIPQLVEEAGLSATFQECFDQSLELYSMLQSKGYLLEAQYATLLGHKMRWKMTMNAREAFHFIELRTSPQGHPGYRKIAKKMHDKICEVTPIIGDAMKFVNQDEDPELSRLASERYTQFKLRRLDELDKSNT